MCTAFLFFEEEEPQLVIRMSRFVPIILWEFIVQNDVEVTESCHIWSHMMYGTRRRCCSYVWESGRSLDNMHTQSIYRLCRASSAALHLGPNYPWSQVVPTTLCDNILLDSHRKPNIFCSVLHAFKMLVQWCQEFKTSAVLGKHLPEWVTKR